MKIRLIFITILFISCTHNKYSGKVVDFDTNKPIKNVLVSINSTMTKTDSTGYFILQVNTNSKCIINLQKEGYAKKEVLRNPDFSKENVEKNKIYMFKKDSDFSNRAR